MGNRRLWSYYQRDMKMLGQLWLKTLSGSAMSASAPFELGLAPFDASSAPISLSHCFCALSKQDPGARGKVSCVPLRYLLGVHLRCPRRRCPPQMGSCLVLVGRAQELVRQRQEVEICPFSRGVREHGKGRRRPRSDPVPPVFGVPPVGVGVPPCVGGAPRVPGGAVFGVGLVPLHVASILPMLHQMMFVTCGGTHPLGVGALLRGSLGAGLQHLVAWLGLRGVFDQHKPFGRMLYVGVPWPRGVSCATHSTCKCL